MPILNDRTCGRVAAANQGRDPRRSADCQLPTGEPGERDRVMLDFSVKLTQEPEVVEKSDVQRLREVGFEDEDILHVAELTAIFNYNGRLANALGLVANREYHGLGRGFQVSE